MSRAVLLYAAILLVVIVGLWAAYRVLGTPSRLVPEDYRLVLDDLVQSVGRASTQLRNSLAGKAGRALVDDATQSRKIFQTVYYQTLRLRPLSGPDDAAAVRTTLRQACEAYDWASQMVASESIENPAVRESALRLLDSADQLYRQAISGLTGLPPASGPERPPRSPSVPS